MILKDFLAITGEQGLFRFLAQGKNAIIVEHLETGKRSSAHGSAKVSSLEDIAIFTEKEDMPLSKVFDLIYEKHEGGPAIDPKSDNKSLTTWFGEVLPDYSKNKVYVSDIRKVAQWYNILQKQNLLIKETEEVKSEELQAEDAAESEKSETGAEKEKNDSPKKKTKKSPEA